MIWSLSWKNIWRKKTRSLVVIIAVMLGVLAGVYGSAFMKGMAKQRIQAAIDNETSHIQLHHPNYPENQEKTFYISNADAKVAEIEKMEGTEASSARLKFVSMVQSARASGGVTILAIDPEKEKQVTKIYTQLADSSELAESGRFDGDSALQSYLKDSVGTYFRTEKENAIVIGREMAKHLKVKVRSNIKVYLTDTTGMQTAANFKVVGIYETENSHYDKTHAFVRRSKMASLAMLPESSAHEIAVRLVDMEDETMEKSMEKLKAAYPDLKIEDWKALQPDVGMLTDFMDLWLVIIMGIILLALAFGIINTMMMAVLERIKELGMLMAIGMNKKRILKMIMLESILLTIIGAIVGMILSAFIISYQGQHGVNLADFSQGLKSIGYSPMVYPELDFGFYLIVTLGVIATAIISAIWPARKAIKLNPADALRTD